MALRPLDPMAGANLQELNGDDGEPSVPPTPSALAGRGHLQDMNTTEFEELHLDSVMVSEAQAAWKALVAQAGSAEAAGDAIFTSLFDSAPTLQSLFVTPRAVQALRFVNGLSGAIDAMTTPHALKVAVETLGFQHLHLEVTVPRAVIFRDAILDLLEVELEDRFTTTARNAWMALLNYIGGAFIYVRVNYSERLHMLIESWHIANKASPDNKEKVAAETPEEEQEEKKEEDEVKKSQDGKKKKSKGKEKEKKRQVSADKENITPKEGTVGGDKTPKSLNGRSVPTTFRQMFQFNASVMGFGKRPWMREVLASFNDMVEHVANSPRLQEECDIVALRISKCLNNEAVNLGEYRSCMLASLRQLLMTEWNSSYEMAWNWFWDYVEGALKRTLGSPPAWERNLTTFFLELAPASKANIIKEMYERFFVAAPRGQDYFKQSTSRLHFIAGQLLKLSIDILRDPWKKVDDISALGLRHVGYGIPIELFSPFVTSCMSAVADTEGVDSATLEAFRWSLALIAKILVRTVNEGSTIVMKAINVNSPKALAKAMSCAPRGERAKWLLVVKVGTHSISPLSWAIESGSLEVADAIIKDLLTIRADRERYYYGVDELFGRHPDLIKRLVVEAPSLLPTLLEGLVWRSREAKRGKRRVNYYVKHLLVRADGGFSEALKNLVASNDPQIICHPVIILVSDTLWDGIVRTRFINSRIWLIMSLAIMMLSQAILPKLDAFQLPYVRGITLAGRCSLYLGTMARFLVSHARDITRAYAHKKVFRVGCVPIPEYLQDPYHAASLVLAVLLLLMCLHEPMIYCMGTSGWPKETCDEASSVEFRYSVFCMCGMGTHWLMLMDLAVFNTGLTAFLLVIVNVMSEIGLFLVALTFLLLTFASAISVLEHTYDDMADVLQTVIALFAITVGLYEDDYRDFIEDPVLLGAVFLFVTASAILLLNLLIAQLNCSYVYIYQNMVGFARLKRADVIVDDLSSCQPLRWQRFLASLSLDKPMEFNEGDVGLPGGIQVEEVASLHSVRHDGILRFGGSSSQDLCWPDEAAAKGEDRIIRMEKLLSKTMRRISRLRGRGGGGSGGGAGQSMSEAMSSEMPSSDASSDDM